MPWVLALDRAGSEPLGGQATRAQTGAWLCLVSSVSVLMSSEGRVTRVETRLGLTALGTEPGVTHWAGEKSRWKLGCGLRGPDGRY